MFNPGMFDANGMHRHLGTNIAFRGRLRRLEQLERYFRKKCIRAGIEYSYDCTADENTYFKTINYTSYAGLFMMQPLCISHGMFQMFDAKADNMKDAGHIDWILENLKNKQGGKYTDGTGKELKKSDLAKDGFTALLVLPGSNKIYQHTSTRKLKHIIKQYGKHLVIKPHPLTKADVLADLEKVQGKALIADKHSDLYDLMERSKKVFTTHISETALTGLLLGKKVSPMEVFGRRHIGAFAHINHFCFSEPDPIPVIKKIFASPKSGIVHPDIDENWQKKIDDYFEYSMTLRDIQKDHYLE